MFARTLDVIDAHVAGCPVKVVTGGIRWPPGLRSIVDFRNFLRHEDVIRPLLLHEPRGYSGGGGVAVLVQPSHPEADVGVVIIEPGSYPEMCGHCVLGVAAVLVKMGMVPVKSPRTLVRIETPAGLVEASVDTEGKIVGAVRLRMPRSFCQIQGAKLEVEGYGGVAADIAFGGIYYIIVESDNIRVALARDNALEIVKAGIAIRAAAQKSLRVRHPSSSDIVDLYQVMLVGRVESGDGSITVRNAVIYPPDYIDRSPCGTGTSAYMAVLSATGRMQPGDSLRSSSIVDTVFQCTFENAEPVGDYPTIVPTLATCGYLTAVSKILLEVDDKFIAPRLPCG